MPPKEDRDSGISAGRPSLELQLTNLELQVVDEEAAGDGTGNMAAANPGVAAAAAIIPASKIPAWSGHPEGTQYQGATGLVVELNGVRGWLTSAEQIGAASQWDRDTVLLNQAILAFIPASPAANWFCVQTLSNNAPKTWDEFKAGLIKEFTPKMDASRRGELLNSMKQRSKETSGDFMNRITISYSEFLAGWSASLPRGIDAGVKAVLDEQIKSLKDYHLSSFFLIGLREPMLSQVTLSGEDNLERMVDIAKRAEQALAKKPGQAAAVGGSEKDLKTMINNLVDQAVAAKTKNDSQGGEVAATGSKKNKSRPLSEVICFFCFVTGHYSNDCKQRKEERDKGHWRPTVKDDFMTKAQYDALPPATKNKGKSMAVKSTAKNASVQQGITYAASAGGSVGVQDEEEWNNFFRNPNA